MFHGPARAAWFLPVLSSRLHDSVGLIADPHLHKGNNQTWMHRATHKRSCMAVFRASSYADKPYLHTIEANLGRESVVLWHKSAALGFVVLL